ncbi:carboxypeptidase regulatory-like domain-containing protein [bacterium]|nr:carboxypeptidase regulatory-like domain-containing protein [bacterium]
MLAHRIKATIGAITAVGLLGLFALPSEVHAAITVTVTDSSGTAVGGAFVAVLNSDGDAVDSAITAKDGTVSVNETGGAGLVVAAPGFQTKAASSAIAQTVALTASTKSKLSYANAFGAQVRTIAADGESGVYYATSDAQPTVWRTSDYAGSWSPVPTTADSDAGTAATAGAMPQTDAASEIFTSGVKGEVGVQVGQNLYFSRTYGNTWSTVANYSAVTGQNKKHYWVHGGANAEYSYIVGVTDSGMYVAVMPDSSSDAAPSFVNVTSTIGRYSAADRVAFAVGSTGDIFMATVNGTSTRISKITPAATAASLAATEASLPQPTHTMATSGTGLVKLSALGTATPQALVTHLVDGATVSINVGALVSGAWTMSSGVEGSNQANSLTLNGMSALSGNCGQNGNTPLVASIAPEAPSGSDVLTGFEVVGTIGQCMFVFNATGSGSLLSTTFTSPKVALLAMEGANNNTGFVWDSGFNFSSNMVSLSGDGQFGLRKSAVISAATSYRPSFGGAGGTTASQYINSQAIAGTDVASGGIAVGGMVAPNVTDVVYSPNSTDGSQLVLSMTETGGSRTLLSTDGGVSFSTVGAGGSRAVEWWNGASGLQHIAAGFSMNPNEFLQVKSFNTNTGTGKLDMGDELAATAAERDAKDAAARKEFSFPGAANPSGSTLTPSSFASGGNQHLLSAIEGIAGKDAMLVGVNKCSQNLGPSGCESSAGSVALVGISANSSTGAVTLSNIKYFGSEVASGGVTSAGTGTYAGDVKAIQYCPTGSATKVADTAFISVGGKGIYKITAVGTAPAHAATGTTTGTYKDLKVDCDTGVIAVAGSDGLYFSVDGAAKFVKITTTAAPAGGQQQPPQQGGDSAPTAVALQADGTTGEVTMIVASGNGDIKSVETSFTALGVSAADTKAGTATTPTAAITPSSDSLNELNSSATGKNTGAVLDLEIPNTAADKVTAAGVRTLSVRKFATASKLSAGTGGGAFKASLRTTTTSSGSGAGTPGVGGTTPGANTPGVIAPKVVSVKKGKTVSVTSALKTLGTTVVAKSKIVATVSTASKKVCSVSKTNVVKGLKAGKCSLTVKITPPATKKVKKPKTTTKKISITIA